MISNYGSTYPYTYLVSGTHGRFVGDEILTCQSNQLRSLLCKNWIFGFQMPFPFELLELVRTIESVASSEQIGRRVFLRIPDGLRVQIWMDPSFSLLNNWPAATTGSREASGLNSWDNACRDFTKLSTRDASPWFCIQEYPSILKNCASLCTLTFLAAQGRSKFVNEKEDILGLYESVSIEEPGLLDSASIEERTSSDVVVAW